MPKFVRQHSLQKLFPKPRLVVSSHTSSILLMLETENGSEIQPRVMCLHISISDLKKDCAYRPSKSISSFDECSELMLRYYILPDVFLFARTSVKRSCSGYFPYLYKVPKVKWYFRKIFFFLHSCECIEV